MIIYLIYVTLNLSYFIIQHSIKNYYNFSIFLNYWMCNIFFMHVIILVLILLEQVFIKCLSRKYCWLNNELSDFPVHWLNLLLPQWLKTLKSYCKNTKIQCHKYYKNEWMFWGKFNGILANPWKFWVYIVVLLSHRAPDYFMKRFCTHFEKFTKILVEIKHSHDLRQVIYKTYYNKSVLCTLSEMCWESQGNNV